MTTTAQAIDLPFDEAIDFFRQKKNVYTEGWSDLWKEAHSRGFMVAGAATDALLQDFREAVDKAISKGTTLAEFRTEFDTIVKKHGWSYNGGPGWRSRVIYETNLTGAYSAGRYAQMTDPDVQAAYPFWQYVHSGSSHPRLQHLAWDGLTLRSDDGFWDSHYPPNGWHCGCRVRPLSGAAMGRLGKTGPDKTPPIEYRDWKDKKTGIVHKVPVGIDPGFDYNPGKAWKAPVKSDPMKALPGPGTPTHPDASAPMPDLKPAIAQFLAAPEGAIAVGDLPAHVMKILKTSEPKVLLSAGTMVKQDISHPDLVDKDYAVLPELLHNPTVVLRQDDNHVLLLRRSGHVWVGTVKATAKRDENYLQSLYKARAHSVRLLLKRHSLVFGDADDLSDE